MKYIYTITTTNQDGTTTTTTAAAEAADARTVHNIAAQYATSGAVIRVYPDTTTAEGLARGALLVARRTSINGIKRVKGNASATQWRMEKELAAANARCRGSETAERIIDVIRDYSPDTQDFFGYAMAGLIDGKAAGKGIAEQYHESFLTLNRYIRSQRAATDKETSTEYIIDGGGNIVSINGVLASIIRGGEKWTPTDGGTMDAATAERLGAAIADAMRTVSPTQRRIAELLARGYSQRQIAKMTGRNERTVKENIAIMRGKVADYVRNNTPEFAYMAGGNNGESTIDTNKAVESAAAANSRRTEGGTARHAEQMKATQAERARRYRERKKAEENKTLSYDELISLARKHYNDGGDGIVECWDENTYNTYIKEYGPITTKVAMQIIKA